MNRIYKVIYSKARQCYIVVSELAKSNHKSSQQGADHTNTPALARIIAVALAAGALTWGSVPGVSWAADNTTVIDSNEKANINTTINNVDKKVAVIFDDKGSLMSTDATIYHNHEDGFGITNVSKGIALGHNAYVFNQGGGKADAMLFGSPTYTSGIAIGENAYVLEDSIDLGNKIYKGAMGDVSDLSKYDAKTSSGTGRLLIGNNSYSSGTLSTLIGNHSIMTTNYLNGRRWNAMQNAGAVSIGALNSIESYSSDSNMSGVANSIIGLANKTTNANGALILGAGNEIKNSITSISVSGSASTDVATASQAIRDSMANGYAGGATLIIGGGNKTDYTQSSQIIGVGSSITGTKENPAQFNMLNGVQSHINNSSSVYAIGYQNTIGNSNKSIVVGDYHKLDGGNNNVIIGSMDSVKKTETIVHHGWLGDWTEEVTTETPIEHTKNLEDAVMIGHNANAKVNKGVALGAGSVASVDKNAIGYDPVTKKPSTVDSSTWKSTAAAVSIGDASQNITRQITNLAAGAQDTDAVNVAQLKAAQTHFYSVNSTDETADNYNNDGAKGKNSLAAGVGALANGSNSVAIGTKAKAQNDALAVGESANAGNNGIAIGMHANAGYGQNMALGYYADVANDVRNSTALGYGSQVTKRDILQSDGSDGVVSVGKSVGQSGEKGMTRRIINVKDGVKATDAANVSQLTELKEGEHISIVDSATPNEKGQTVKTISVKVDGQIKEGDTGILSGDTVYNEVHVKEDGNDIKSNQTVAENLKALDSHVKTNADNIEKNGQAIEKNSARIDTNSKNIEKNSQAIEKNSARIDTNSKNIEKNGQAIEKNSARIDTNSKNIEKNGQAIEKNSARIDTNSKNIEKNGQAIEKNSARIDTNSKNIEKNSQAIEKNSTRIDTNSKNIETLQKTKADTNLSNITDAGKTVINNIAKKSVKVEAGSSNVSVTTKDVADGPITYTVDVAKDLHVNSITSKTVTSDSVTAKTVTSDTVKTKNLSVSESASIGDVTINKGNQGTIDGLKNTAWDAKNITSGRAATEDQVKAATKNAVNYDGDTSKTITLREDTTIKNVANTAIEQGSKNAVNAGTVYNETRVKQDGKYVKASNTAGENLSVLDNQVASNSSNITNLNGRVNNLDSKVNKVGAGAAALAALHPLDFDPEDKWDFAVGYGNYRDANSVAVGAFYRPDDDTMFSVGTNFGNGENMINAGVSFKFGPKGKSQVRPGSTQEITELRATVARQDDQLKKQDSEIKELKAMVQQLMAKQDKQAATK